MNWWNSGWFASNWWVCNWLHGAAGGGGGRSDGGGGDEDILAPRYAHERAEAKRRAFERSEREAEMLALFLALLSD